MEFKIGEPLAENGVVPESYSVHVETYFGDMDGWETVTINGLQAGLSEDLELLENLVEALNVTKFEQRWGEEHANDDFLAWFPFDDFYEVDDGDFPESENEALVEQVQEFYGRTGQEADFPYDVNSDCRHSIHEITVTYYDENLVQHKVEVV